ncbi:hypothetical protein [Entomobacter blattae]|nr:hypothetical protein [Entomobacter blattae]
MMSVLYLPAWLAALIVLFFDGIVAVFFIFLARNKKASEAEVMVLKQRDNAWDGFKESLAFTAFLGATAGPLGRFLLKSIMNLVIKKISGKHKKNKN